MRSVKRTGFYSNALFQGSKHFGEKTIEYKGQAASSPIGEVSIYPNPSTSGGNIRIVSEEAIRQIRVYTIKGGEVTVVYPGTNDYSLQLPEGKGQYILRIYGHGSFTTKQVIVE